MDFIYCLTCRSFTTHKILISKADIVTARLRFGLELCTYSCFHCGELCYRHLDVHHSTSEVYYDDDLLPAERAL